jgi:iron complex outermembrane receptor protein
MDTARRRSSVLVHAAVAMAIAGGAHHAAHAQAASAPAGAEELSEVVVTGSRIVRRDYESQSPIVTVPEETFEERSAIGIEATLQALPQFAQSAGAQSNSGSSTPFPSPTAAPGAATANLRGLGTNRNLVLVDGRRVQPANGNLVVDLNTIPSAAIQSVEVISGGAAAVYGADAISGVVNLILKKNFQGLQIDAQYGVTQEGDGEQSQVSALFGSNFADGRGNVMMGATYAKRGDVRGKDRDWVVAGWDDPGTPAGGIPGGTGLSAVRCALGPVRTCPNPGDHWLPINGGTSYLIDQNGNLFDPNDPLNPDHPYTGPIGGTSGFKVNPNGSLGYTDRENSWLSVPLERWALFASANFDLSDRVEIFTEARFTETQTTARGTHIGLFNFWEIIVPYNQAYDDPDSPTFGQGPPGFTHHPVPRAVADLLNARAPGQATLPPTYRTDGVIDNANAWRYEGGVDYIPIYRTDTTSNLYQIITGLRGRLPFRDWTWEVYGSHGKTQVNARLPAGFIHHERTETLFRADQYGVGWKNPVTQAVTGACTTGLPIFNPDGSVNNSTTISQDCDDWIHLRMNNVTELTQEVAEANVQGTLFDIWAGPLQFAAGAAYRAERFTFTPDAAYNGNQVFGEVVNNIALPLGVSGQTHVKEAYAEFAIPLLTDVPFVRKLEIDPGIRISDYKTEGNVTTWKIMGDWTVTDWMRFRGGFQKATRAPNLNELFMPVGASAVQTALDGCGNWPTSPSWANVPGNPNRLNLQILCQHLMVRDGAPPTLYVPGEASANNYSSTVFAPVSANAFPFDLGIQGGNPNLESETADTITAGIVLRSPFQNDLLSGLTLSVDYYKIDLEGAIAAPNGAQVYQQCLDARFNPAIASSPGSLTGAELAAGNPYCALIMREYSAQFPYGANRNTQAQFRNLGGIKTDGIDVQIDWRASIGSIPGMFSVNVQYNYLGSFQVSPFAGAPFTERKGTWDSGYNFDWRTLTTFGYSNGPWSVGLRWQHLPGLERPPSASPNTLPLASHDNFDLFGRWALNQRYEFRAGIDNLLNSDPEIFGATFVQGNPAASNNALGTSAPVHDTFGRRFYVAVKVSL